MPPNRLKNKLKNFTKYVHYEYTIHNKNKKELLKLLQFTEEYFDEKLAEENTDWETLTRDAYKYTTAFQKSSKIDLAGGMEYLIPALNENTIQRVSDELGYKSSSAINIYLQNRGLTFKEIIKNKPVKKSEIELAGGLTFILENRLKGKSLSHIAKELNIKTPNILGYYLNNKGYSWGKLPDPVNDFKRKVKQKQKINDKYIKRKKRKSKKPPAYLEQVVKLIIEGKSKKDVANYFNISYSTVDSWLKMDNWTWKSLHYELNMIKKGVYYISNLGQYRGTCTYYGRVYDTGYCDNESEVECELKKLMVNVLLEVFI